MSCPGQAPVNVFVPTGAGPAPPPPPPPPGPAEVVASTPFPAETIHHDPCFAGLTGLASYMWATVNNAAVPPITASTTIRGYTVSTSAHPVSYRWDMGNGAVLVGPISGTDKAPSVTYTYQKKGSYQLTLTVMWAGTFTFTGYGVTQTRALGPVAQAAQHLPWLVEEVRSVLVAPGPGATTTVPAVPSAC